MCRRPSPTFRRRERYSTTIQKPRLKRVYAVLLSGFGWQACKLVKCCPELHEDSRRKGTFKTGTPGDRGDWPSGSVGFPAGLQRRTEPSPTARETERRTENSRTLGRDHLRR